MATERQIQANRENAQKSTGPRDTTRTRLNATKTGLFSSETVLVSGPIREDPEELADLREQLLEVLQPANMVEALVADDFVRAAWQLRRYCRYETAMIGLAAAGYLSPVTDHPPSREELAAQLNELNQVREELRATAATDPIAAWPTLARRLYAYLQPYLPKDTECPEAEDADEDWTEYGRKILARICAEWHAEPVDIWDQLRAQLQTLRDNLQDTVGSLRRQLLVQETLALGLEMPYHVTHRGEQSRREFYAVLREYRALKAAEPAERVREPNLLQAKADREA